MNKGKKKRDRITFGLPREVNRMIREEAKRHGMTLSNFIWVELKRAVLRYRKTKGGALFFGG